MQDVHLLWTCEIHDNLAVIRPQPKGGIVLRLDRSWCLVHLAESENVVDRGAETEALVDLLLLGGCDLHKLAPNFDDYLDLAFRFRQSRYRLEDVSGISHDTNGLLWEVQLAEMEVSLQILEATYKLVFHVSRVEDTVFVLA